MISNLILLGILVIAFVIFTYHILKGTPDYKKGLFLLTTVIAIVITYGICKDIAPLIKKSNQNVIYIPAPSGDPQTHKMEPPTKPNKIKMYPLHKDSL